MLPRRSKHARGGKKARTAVSVTKTVNMVMLKVGMAKSENGEDAHLKEFRRLVTRPLLEMKATGVKPKDGVVALYLVCNELVALNNKTYSSGGLAIRQSVRSEAVDLLYNNGGFAAQFGEVVEAVDQLQAVVDELESRTTGLESKVKEVKEDVGEIIDLMMDAEAQAIKDRARIGANTTLVVDLDSQVQRIQKQLDGATGSESAPSPTSSSTATAAVLQAAAECRARCEARIAAMKGKMA